MRKERRGEVGALQTQLTSSLKGIKGTVGSSRCMSSLSSARKHSARLSTSRAMGPATVVTEQKRGRFLSSFLLPGIPTAWPQRVGPGAMIRSQGSGAGDRESRHTVKAAQVPDRRISAGAEHQKTSRRD